LRGVFFVSWKKRWKFDIMKALIMAQKMDMNDEEKIKEIEKIHSEFKQKMDDLRREQDKVLEEYLAELEQAKMEELRNKLQAS